LTSGTQRPRLLVGGIVAVLALAALAGVFAWRQYDDGKRHALNELDARVVLAATVFDTYFSGELSQLRSIAETAAVRAGNAPAMTAYFRRVQPKKGSAFSGGLGWIDRDGRVRASSAPTPAGPALNVADRGYFRTVLASDKPFISGGLISRHGRRRLIVMAVPTHDSSGRLNGVLAGALRLQQAAPSKQSVALGFQGVVVIDRDGQELTEASFARPANTALLRRMRKHQTEVLSDTHGLTGSGGRVVAYATTPLAGWITAIDRSPSSVFASARRVLALQLASIVAAALLIFFLLIWIYRRANRNAVAVRRRNEIVAELTRSLADAYTPNDVAAALATALSKSFPGSAAVVGLAEGGRSELTLAAVEGQRPSTIAAGDPVLLGPAAEAYERGAKQTASGQAAVARAFPELQRAAARGIAAVYATPILGRRGGKLGAVALLLADPVSFAAANDAIVDAHLEQAIQALGRTLRQEHEHEVAVELQRSLLPAELPEQDDVSFAARYHAGGTGVEVGGDWYDAVRRPDGLLHVSVGDVAGRGIAAATLMAQLRNAFRAYAFDCTSPAEITRRLQRHIPSGGMVTTVCLTFDPYTRRFGYSLAGHPPVLILDGATATVTTHSAAGSPPLGFAGAEAIVEEWLTLPEPATVVAYTDGLVERRGVNIDTGIERIVSVLARTSGGSAEETAEALLTGALAKDPVDDDAALVVMRAAAVPARFDVEIPADALAMSALRRRLDTWLSLRGIDEAERIDAVLVVHEACINSIEHGYQLNGGTIRLHVEHDGDTLGISVEDTGTWRPPTPDPSRGRGTQIMETTMLATDIAHGADGTRVVLRQRLGSNAGVAPTV